MYESHARDLTTSDEEKFRTMVEKLDFDGVEDFKTSWLLKENFFNEDEPVKTSLVEEFAVSEEEAFKEDSAELTPAWKHTQICFLESTQ